MTSVIIYTYFKSDVADFNLDFYVKNEVKFRNNIDYIIVINGYEYNKNIYFPDIQNLTVIKRENLGYDFGGHNYALNYLDSINKNYDYYFFMNAGVFGPILKEKTDSHWSNLFINKINDKVKVVSTSIVCLPDSDVGGYGPKTEGFFFMTDNIGIKILRNEKTIFCNHKRKRDAIIDGEYGVAKAIFSNYYTIDCMLEKYKNIDWNDKNNWNLNNNKHPSRMNSFYGNSIDPYEVIFHKWYWLESESETVNKDIIDNYIHKNHEKTIILFVFHEMNIRVKNFIKNCIFKDKYIDFLVICNNKEIKIDVPDYVNVF